MPVCGEGQKPNIERETKTTLNCFSLDWIWYVRAHEKNGIAAVAEAVWLLTQELPAKKGGIDN